MQMIGGKSFSIDGDTAAGGLEPLRANDLQNAKEWDVLEGRTFLIESIPSTYKGCVSAMPMPRRCPIV